MMDRRSAFVHKSDTPDEEVTEAEAGELADAEKAETEEQADEDEDRVIDIST